MAIGVSYERFMDSNPKELKPFVKAQRLRDEMLDEKIWASVGSYVLTATYVAYDRVMQGKKSKAEYIKEPIVKANNKYEGLTDEEIAEIEIRKAILNEERWIANDKARGLPETKIC